MAKRRRLALPDMAAGAQTPPPLETKALFAAAPRPAISHPAAPIARVAGDAAVMAAFEDLVSEVSAARETGRMILALPLDAVDEGYLIRDRMIAEADELAVLSDSLRARGQQTPIEVVATGAGRYGLISGWRRLTALRQLHKEMPQDLRFASVLAILRRPETASDAYLAMVEENEIRVGLSYYERARIVARAAEQGVFADTAEGLSQLFAAASRAKRSKIGSFLRLYSALDDRLRFPSAISERLGLALVRALEGDPDFGPRLRDRLRKTPAADAEAERSVLERALQGGGSGHRRPDRAATPGADLQTRPAMGAEGIPAGPAEEVVPGLRIETDPGRIILSGPAASGALAARLVAWLRSGAGRG